MKAHTIAALLAASLIWGCGDDSTPSADACKTFETTLTVSDRMSQSVNTFNVGEDITFGLQITNKSNMPATLTAGSSCTAVVFETFDSGKQRLWGSADGIACLMMLQPRTYQGYESVNHTNTWHPPSTPGTYSVTANVGQYMTDSQGQQFSCRDALSKSATFMIR